MKQLIIIASLFSAKLYATTSNITLTSDYVFRGVSLGAPAIQGSIGHNFETGLAISGWASNITDGQEFDLTVGYAKSITEKYSLHGNAIWYDYTKKPGGNYLEYNIGLSRDSYNFEVFYAPEYGNLKKNSITYFELNGTQGIAEKLSISALVGYSLIDKEELANQKSGTINYQVGFIHDTVLMDLGIFYSDTNRETSLGEKQHDQSLFFEASKNF